MGEVKLFVGQKILGVRMSRGISQENLATELGLSQSWVSNVETGDLPIDFDRLCQIADILQVNVNSIINYDNSVTFNSCTQSGYINTNNINPIDKIETLYEKIIQEKDERIKYLETLIKSKE